MPGCRGGGPTMPPSTKRACRPAIGAGRLGGDRVRVDVDSREAARRLGDVERGVGRTDREQDLAAAAELFDVAGVLQPGLPRPLGGRLASPGRGPEDGLAALRRAAPTAAPISPGCRRPTTVTRRFSPTPSRPSCARRRRQEARRLVERQPARLGHLDPHRLVDLADAPAARPEEEEAHDLEDPLARSAFPRGRVDVADVAELLDEPPLDAGLLAHLAHAVSAADSPGSMWPFGSAHMRSRPPGRIAATSAGRGSSARARLRRRTPAARARFYHAPVGSCVARVPTVQWLRHSRGESARKCH